MRAISTAFQEGGAPMYLVLALALGGHGVAIAALFAGGARDRLLLFGGATLLAAALTFGAGWLGYERGLGEVDRAVVNVSPDVRAELRAVGEHEARRNVDFGLYACLLPGLVAVIQLGRGLAKPN